MGAEKGHTECVYVFVYVYIIHFSNSLSTAFFWAEEMAQWSGALAVIEDLNLVPRTHRVPLNYLPCVTTILENLTALSTPGTDEAHIPTCTEIFIHIKHKQNF